MTEPLQKPRQNHWHPTKEWIEQEVVRAIGRYMAPLTQDLLDIERLVDHVVNVVGKLRVEFHGRGKAKASEQVFFNLMQAAGDYDTADTNGTAP